MRRSAAQKLTWRAGWLAMLLTAVSGLATVPTSGRACTWLPPNHVQLLWPRQAVPPEAPIVVKTTGEGIVVETSGGEGLPVDEVQRIGDLVFYRPRTPWPIGETLTVLPTGSFYRPGLPLRLLQFTVAADATMPSPGWGDQDTPGVEVIRATLAAPGYPADGVWQGLQEDPPPRPVQLPLEARCEACERSLAQVRLQPAPTSRGRPLWAFAQLGGTVITTHLWSPLESPQLRDADLVLPWDDPTACVRVGVVGIDGIPLFEETRCRPDRCARPPAVFVIPACGPHALLTSRDDLDRATADACARPLASDENTPMPTAGAAGPRPQSPDSPSSDAAAGCQMAHGRTASGPGVLLLLALALAARHRASAHLGVR